MAIHFSPNMRPPYQHSQQQPPHQQHSQYNHYRNHNQKRYGLPYRQINIVVVCTLICQFITVIEWLVGVLADEFPPAPRDYFHLRRERPPKPIAGRL